MKGKTEAIASASRRRRPAATRAQGEADASLLLQQLHQVQEELELHYMRCLDLDAELQLARIARDDAARESDALRMQLAHMQRELAARGSAPAPSGSLAGRLARRLRAALGGRDGKAAPKPEIAAIRSCEWFDAEWYLASYGDVREAGMDPAEHYCEFGWREGRNPGPAFDTISYLRANPDVAAAGLNPLWHFVEYGRKEGRTPRKN